MTIETEGMVGTTFEFINSFRDTEESEFPEFRSQNAVDALEKIREIKNKVSSGINNE